MATIIEKGFIIKVSQYKEFDAILTLLSEKGELISFKGRSILKPSNKNFSSCQLYAKGEYCLENRTSLSHLFLKNSSLIEGVYDLINDTNSCIVLGLVVESILLLSDAISAKERISFFSATINSLKASKNYRAISLIILKYLMIYNGIILEANHCVKCGSKHGIINVDYQEGGYICQNCNGTATIKPPSYLRMYHFIIKADLINSKDILIDDSTFKLLARDFFNYLEDSAGLKLKSRNLIFEML
ncbi:MAG: DNA repair protein RecO [Bacilli bacterium]|nr:DNA repair protein RecO [Bacilli bacterium]